MHTPDNNTQSAAHSGLAFGTVGTGTGETDPRLSHLGLAKRETPDPISTMPYEKDAPLNYAETEKSSKKTIRIQTYPQTAKAKCVLHAPSPTVAVLAVQGAFIEHERKLEHLGARCIELRCVEDLNQPFDGLVLPGGESTVQGKLIRELGMEEPLRQLIQNGMPVLATCAGMILLAEHIESEDTQWLGTIPMTVRRNAYGRQLGSFHHEGEIADLSPEPFTAPFTFIRAPFVTEAASDVKVLATVNDAIVAVRFGNQIALAFHPELDDSNRIHQAFLDLVQQERFFGSASRGKG